MMDRKTREMVNSLDYRVFKVLEISGSKWKSFGFAEYRSLCYPDYDVCKAALADQTFDLIIAEQVFEHLLWPYRAAKNVYQMLNKDGVFLITTPFLLKVHNYPVDCSRWTELGLKHLLAEGGFDLNNIITGSWGNKACVQANLRVDELWPNWIPWKHSLKNQPEFPVVVWGLARKRSY